MSKYCSKGYTLVEIIIVVAIIGVITSIILPSYLRSSRTSAKNVCINNLRQIDSAMEQWAMDRGIMSGTTPTDDQETQIYSYIKGARPRCPSGGTYTLNAVGAIPQVACSRQADGHLLLE